MEWNEIPEGTKCVEENCAGDVDSNNYTTIRTGCSSFSTVYACNTCGRLHFFYEGVNGEPATVSGAINRQDKRAFLIAGGEIEHRD